MCVCGTSLYRPVALTIRPIDADNRQHVKIYGSKQTPDINADSPLTDWKYTKSIQRKLEE